MDAKLLKKSIAQQIATFFELHFDDVIWQKDPHYKTYLYTLFKSSFNHAMF